MERSIAHFTIILAVPILVEDRRGAKRAFKVEHDAYEVEVAWDDKDVHSRVTKPNARRPCYGISTLKISVGRPLRRDQYPKDDEPKTEPGPRLDHADVAAIIMKRLIRYFRFTLGNPLLEAVRAQDLRSSNPEWTIENPNPSTIYVPARNLEIVSQRFEGLRHSPAFGIKPFTPEQSHEFERALQADTGSELYEDLMVDARDALMQRNVPRRAVIEMATACEVLTKELFAKKRRSVQYTSGSGYTCEKGFWRKLKSTIIRKIGIISNIFSHAEMTPPTGLFQSYTVKGQNSQLSILSNLPSIWWESLETLIAWVRSQ